MFRDRQGFMQGINMYVPAMQWAASVNMNGGSVVSLGRPLLANDAYVIANTPTNGLANSSVYLPAPISLADATYGRPLVLTTLGAGTATLNVFGEDYLGQPMSENFAPTSVTPVVGKKAFYRVLGVKTITPTGGAVGCKIGTIAANLGLPFKAGIEWAKEAGTMIDFAFANYVPPDLSDPATATTGDPRGQYKAVAAFDGVKEFIVSLRADSSLNANNNGGLHGIRHFNA